MSIVKVKRVGTMDEFRLKLLGIAERSKDIQPALPDVQDKFMEISRDLFDSEGATGAHGSWPANRPSTISAKGHARVLRGKPSKGLELLASLTDPSHPNHVFETTPTSVEMGTKDPKASIHAKGKGSRGRTLPRRRPVDPTEMDKQKLVDIISIFVVEGIQGGRHA